MATKKKKTSKKKKMEPSKKPDQGGEAAKSEEKVFDVAKPGEGKMPSTTSRPTIVTHKSMGHDPMMVAPKSSEDTEQQPDTEAEKPETKKASKLRIEPLSGEGSKEADDAEKTPDPATVESPEEAAADVAEKTASKGEAPKDPEPPKPADAEDKAAESASGGDDDENLDEMNDYAAQVESKKEQKAEEDEATKRRKAAEKLIEGRQYFVPINSVSRRRTKRVAFVFLLLVVTAAGTGTYVLFG